MLLLCMDGQYGTYWVLCLCLCCNTVINLTKPIIMYCILVSSLLKNVISCLNFGILKYEFDLCSVCDRNMQQTFGFESFFSHRILRDSQDKNLPVQWDIRNMFEIIVRLWKGKSMRKITGLDQTKRQFNSPDCHVMYLYLWLRPSLSLRFSRNVWIFTSPKK